MRNHKYDYIAGLPAGFGVITPNVGILEMNVPQFGDGFFVGVPAIAWRQEFSTFDSPMTYFCSFKVTDNVPEATNLFSNCSNSIDGVFQVDLIDVDGVHAIRITTCQSGATTVHQTPWGNLPITHWTPGLS